MIPAGILLFAFDPALLGFLALQEMVRQTPQGAEVFRRVAHAGPALVPPKFTSSIQWHWFSTLQSPRTARAKRAASSPRLDK